MEMMEFTKDDIKAATRYFETYMALRRQLDYAEVDSEDVQDYLSYREHMLTPKQKELVEVMVDGMMEELKDQSSKRMPDKLNEFLSMLDGNS